MTRFDVTFRDYVAPSGWKLSRAMRRLNVRSEPFDYQHNNGADGYSYERVLSIRPDPQLWTVPIIAAHELAHIVLGHTDFLIVFRELGLNPDEIPFAQFELEAHSVAQAVALGLELEPRYWRADLVQQYIDNYRREVGSPNRTTLLRLSNAVVTILEAGQKAAG